MSTALKPTARVRTLGAGVALAVCALITTGCAGAAASNGTAAKASKPPATPKETLLASVPTTSTGPYSYSIRYVGAPDTLSDVVGTVNPPGKAYQTQTEQKDANLGFTTTVNFRIVEQKVWMKIFFRHTEGLTGIPDLPEKWMLLEPAKITAK